MVGFRAGSDRAFELFGRIRIVAFTIQQILKTNMISVYDTPPAASRHISRLL